MDAREGGPLTLSPEEMRRFGHRVVDLLVDRITGLGERPVLRPVARRDLAPLFGGFPPEEGRPWEEVLARVERDVLAHAGSTDHPRFFAFVSTPSNFVSVLADTLATGHNVFAGTWMEAAGPAMVELEAVEWLQSVCGLPESAGGLFVSGGAMANLTGLAAMREAACPRGTAGAVVYASDQTHSVVARGLRLLGFAPDQLRRLPSDDGFRLPLETLRAAAREDRAAGRRPCAVVANAGTTNTGAVDPLGELADFCAAEGLWLHADGSYGAPAVLDPRGAALLAGLGRVDSLAIDPHKWLFQPYEIGCVLVRDRAALRRAFRLSAEYLEDTKRDEDEVNFYEYGPQLTRSFRALKLWMSLQVFGLRAFRDAVARGMDLAEKAEAMLRADGRFEVTSPARLAVVAFRLAPAGAGDGEADALNRAVVERMLADGLALVTSTVLRGRVVLRFCTINPRTTEEDLRRTIRRLAELGRLPAPVEGGGRSHR